MRDLSLNYLLLLLRPALLLAILAGAITVILAKTTELTALVLGSPPKVQFETTRIEFGRVLKGQDLERTFSFKNIGERPLRILNVQAGCLCTATILSESIIAAGQTGSIKVAVDTGKAVADVKLPEEFSFLKSVVVTTNDPRNTKVTLTLAGRLDEEFVFPNDRLIDFGYVTSSQSVSKSIPVRFLPSSNARIATATSTDPDIEVRVVNSVANASLTEIVTTLKSGARTGWHIESIILRTTSQWMPEIRVPVRAQVVKSDY